HDRGARKASRTSQGLRITEKTTWKLNGRLAMSRFPLAQSDMSHWMAVSNLIFALLFVHRAVSPEAFSSSFVRQEAAGGDCSGGHLIKAARCAGRRYRIQNIYFSATWISRMLVRVLLILPKVC